MSETQHRHAPKLDLREAVELAGQVKESVGFSPVSRETIAEALGHQSLSGSAASKIGALNHYGLIEKREDGMYRVSELGRRILAPVDGQERGRALAEAARSPTLFQELFDEFGGNQLPGMLSNILIRRFGIHTSSADDVADSFRKSVEYAGLLRDGTLRLEQETDNGNEPTNPTEDDSEETQTSPAALRASLPEGAEYQTYTIALDGSGRVGSLTMPIPVSGADLRRLSAWITYMESVLDVETPDGSSH